MNPEIFRLLSIKQQLKLEKRGLKSIGGALLPRLAQEFGLKPRDSHETYIAEFSGRPKAGPLEWRVMFMCHK